MQCSEGSPIGWLSQHGEDATAHPPREVVGLVVLVGAALIGDVPELGLDRDAEVLVERFVAVPAARPSGRSSATRTSTTAAASGERGRGGGPAGAGAAEGAGGGGRGRDAVLAAVRGGPVELVIGSVGRT
ncbi:MULTISPECIES: hypothetical protein [unclassified Saccharothrix]|uniref:hypothetical protein n=1 Tax=unclassified Saccharothrix TaxID=2593673 RepID=UPI00307D144B